MVIVAVSDLAEIRPELAEMELGRIEVQDADGHPVLEGTCKQGNEPVPMCTEIGMQSLFDRNSNGLIRSASVEKRSGLRCDRHAGLWSSG